MQPLTGGGGDADVVHELSVFSAKYADALGRHVDDPGDEGLRAATGLGREARREDISMLQLVGQHLEIRRGLVKERGVDHLVDMDAFLSEVLTAFDSTEPDRDGPWRGTAGRDRLEWLTGLSDAYIAIASGETLQARFAEVCIQSRRFLGAADARLQFGKETSTDEPQPDGDAMSCPLLGSAGLLTVTASPGRKWTDAERTALQQLAALISAPINDARRLESAQRSGQLGLLLGGVAQPPEVLARFREVGVERIGADRAAVRLFQGEGFESGDATGAEPLIDCVARDGRARFEVVHSDGATEAWAVLPLGANESRFGVLALGYDDPQPFDEVQCSFLIDASSRLIAALERSRAYARERLARQEAELASARLRDLQALATDLARAATRRRVAQVLLRRAINSTGAVAGVVATYVAGERVEVLAAVGPLRSPRGHLDGLVVDLLETVKPGDSGSLGTVDPADLPEDISAQLSADGVASIACQPIMAGTREVGVLLVGWTDVAGMEQVDDQLLQAQVVMAGQTLQRAARYDVEHTIAETLQRSLLALPPVSLRRLRWSVLYRAGSAGLAGGDWYDLIELDDHRVAVVIGDIVGRGVEAAASMGQLRSATRALATQIASPASLVAALDDYTVSTGQGRYSSLAYVVLDTLSGELAHTVAGHPPPILRLPDGSASTLSTGRGPLLGVECRRSEAVRTVTVGTQLVMYTDGLVERRNEGMDVGLQRLTTAVEESYHALDPDGRCRDLVERLLAPEEGVADNHDDVAIVVVELAAQ